MELVVQREPGTKSRSFRRCGNSWIGNRSAAGCSFSLIRLDEYISTKLNSQFLDKYDFFSKPNRRREVIDLRSRGNELICRFCLDRRITKTR